MRLVQIWLPHGTRQAVLTTLDNLDLSYTVTEGADEDEHDAVVTVPVPTPALETVLEELRGVGIDENTYTIVLEAETIISDEFDDLEAEYVHEPDTTEQRITGEIRIAREELQSRAQDLVLAPATYVVLTLVSAVIATAGLLLDSPATVVGSMVIAPLIGPSMAASVGTVLADRRLFRRGVKMQLLGLGVAILGATIFGLFVRYLHLVPPGIELLALNEISERAAPNFLVLAIAVGAGVAGILSLMTGVSTALVGVMIAVALIPPAAAVGVGLAFGLPRLVLGAGVIVIVNVLSINLASLVMLWFEGYRPDAWLPSQTVRTTLIKQALVLFIGIALVSMFLFGVTYDSYVASTTEQEIHQAIEVELADEPVEFRELTVERRGIIPPLETDRVVITVSIDPDAEIPHIARPLTERIQEITGDDVSVDIEIRLVQSA